MSHFYIPCFIPFSASAIPIPFFIFNVFSTYVRTVLLYNMVTDISVKPLYIAIYTWVAIFFPSPSLYIYIM